MGSNSEARVGEGTLGGVSARGVTRRGPGLAGVEGGDLKVPTLLYVWEKEKDHVSVAERQG